MRSPFLGYAKEILTMFVKRKKNRSGTVSLVVAEKIKGAYKELHTVGIAKGQKDVEDLVKIGHEWIFQEEARRHHRLDLFGE